MRHRENDVSALVGAVDFLYSVCFKAVKRFLFWVSVRASDRNHCVFARDVLQKGIFRRTITAVVRDFQYVAVHVRVSFAIILFVALVTVARKHKPSSRVFENTYRRHGVYLFAVIQMSSIPLFLRQTIKRERVILSSYFVFSDIERDIAIRLRQRRNEKFGINESVDFIIVGKLIKLAFLDELFDRAFFIAEFKRFFIT